MIILRDFREQDYQYLIKWIENERSCCQWCGNNFTYPIDNKQLDKYKKMVDNSDCDYAFTVLSKDSNLPIGHIKIGKINRLQKTGSLQFILVGDKNQRGKGIGKQIIKEAIDYAFNKLDLCNLSLRVFSFNIGGIKCYENIGFKQVGYHEKSFKYSDDEYWDRVEMMLHKNDREINN
ncbi:GNAT family protein [Clostridiaceae bacterium M8S5]|nr:GNAT family protein [Clostridiaceae bacterium M8S5]